MRQFITILTIGCTEATDNKSTDSAEDSAAETLELASDITQAFRVPERAWDLSADSSGLIYATTQAGSLVYQWDPSTNNREELRNRFPDVVALTLDQGTMYKAAGDC